MADGLFNASSLSSVRFMACTRDPIHPIPIIVSWAGESWNWPLWGVFQAPHVGFVSIWTLLAWAVGPVAPRLKDTAKQGFNYNQMQHCPPRSSVMLCVRSSSDSRAASGGGGEMTVCLSAKEPKLHHVLIWAASSCHGADWPTGLFFLFFFLRFLQKICVISELFMSDN